MNSEKSKNLRITKAIFGFSLILSIILSALLLFNSLRWVIMIAVLAVILLGGCRIANVLDKRGRSYSWLLTIAVLNLFIMVPELSLRVAGFSYVSGIANMAEEQFAVLRPEARSIFVPDENLFWKLPPSNENVNSYGFPGDEIEIPKPPNTYRILFLGDSVTQLGYPRYVEGFLNMLLGNGNIYIECITMAVAGYSSYQGKVMAGLYAEKFQPDLAVVFFGWNDHWQAYGSIDSETQPPGDPGVLWHIYQNSRLLQFFFKLTRPIAGGEKSEIIDQVRVPLGEYEENLKEIESRFEGQDAPVLFITAPTSHYRLGVPDYLVENQYAKSKEEVIVLHKAYNEIVRGIAADHNTYLLDLEQKVDSLNIIDKIFLNDGIHFNRQGTEVIAEIIGEYIYDNVLPDSLKATDNLIQ
jgi:lysophospholipase L1-like esterase